MGVKPAFFSKRICSQSLFAGSQMVWDPQKPKIGPLYPPMDPISAHFVGILGQFGVKKTRFSRKKSSAENHSFPFPRWTPFPFPSKTKIGPLYPPMDPMWACPGTFGRHATRLVSHIRAQHYLNPRGKRLGLGQKVPGKHPFGPNQVQFMGPKTHVTLSTKMGQKWQY